MRIAVKSLLLASLVGFSAQAPALTIVPTYYGTVSTSFQNYVQSAINTISGIFTGTNTTVSINFQTTNSGLGASSSGTVGYSYSEFRTALANTTTTSTGALAVANLPGGNTNPVAGGNSNYSVQMTTANARALGLTGVPIVKVGGTGPSYDGIVYINTNAGNFDYVSVVEHEIDEVLGLGSALSVNSSRLPTYSSPEDLFRYDASGNRSFTLSTSAVSFFSVDGNVTPGSSPQFNQDGSGDYGDWCSYTPSACATFGYYVQNAYATRNKTIPYGSPEITALQAIGYNSASPVPVPPAAYLLASGLLGVAVRARRRKIS